VGVRQAISEALIRLLEHGDWRALPPSMSRDIHGHEMGGSIYRAAMKPHLVINGPDGKYHEKLDKAYATRYLVDVLERAKAKDPLEEMLITQMLWTHARVMHLTEMANRQENLKQIRVVSDAADGGSNTFRRLLLALTEYRNPRRSFTAIAQLNAAAQQVVQQNNAPAESENENEKRENEKGLRPPALPAHEPWPGFAEDFGIPGEAVAVDARAGDARGQGAEQPQCAEARPNHGGGDRGAAGVGRVVPVVP
jgi:hypothetical protein